jgi:hypothetical protein
MVIMPFSGCRLSELKYSVTTRSASAKGGMNSSGTLTVLMGWESGAAFHYVVIEHPEYTKLDVGEMAIVGKGEEPVGAEPPPSPKGDVSMLG